MEGRSSRTIFRECVSSSSWGKRTEQSQPLHMGTTPSVLMLINNIFLILKFFLIYFNFWLHWVFTCVCELSLAALSRGLLFVVACGALITAASHSSLRALEPGLSSCGARHVESSQTRDQTQIPCIPFRKQFRIRMKNLTNVFKISAYWTGKKW